MILTSFFLLPVGMFRKVVCLGSFTNSKDNNKNKNKNQDKKKNKNNTKNK